MTMKIFTISCNALQEKIHTEMLKTDFEILLTNGSNAFFKNKA